MKVSIYEFYSKEDLIKKRDKKIKLIREVEDKRDRLYKEVEKMQLELNRRDGH